MMTYIFIMYDYNLSLDNNFLACSHANTFSSATAMDDGEPQTV